MRHSTSCAECRRAKGKCVRSEQDDRCKTCIRKRTHCSFEVRSPPQKQPLRPTPNEGVTDPLLSSDDVEDLVKCYFAYIHDRPHSLFHEATIWADIRSGSIRQSLLYAICGLAASLSSRPHLKAIGPKLASRSRALLLDTLEDVCLANIQA